MRNNSIGFLISLLLLGECITKAEGAPLLRIPLPFLRGGSATVAATKAAKTTKKQRQPRRQRKPGINPIQLVGNNVKQGLGKVGGKIQHDAAFLGKNIGREWGKLNSSTQKFAANIPKLRLPPLSLPGRRRKSTLKSCKKLDEVCHSFSSVQRGKEVDTAQLLKACRAHLAFMKSTGSSLRLVAKDLESNVQKAEKVFKKSPKEGSKLSSLLKSEKSRGIHNGDELHEKSAAMGLLWIRRSLAFQLDLYASLISPGIHPREAAYSAYSKHLSPFHGWALKKVFPASLSQMPERDVFIAKFGGIAEEELNEEYDRVIAKKLKVLVNMWDPLISSWEDEFERLGLEDTRKV
mmetsp:Transcript_29456/g.48314  ORF Transcript_29456/g.48314 Transcript_29456/m.48314 type:complete len:349 (+) Transcript_29456:387-1433(+)|eukprot:CAMPEP_0201906694 /NCGR_PEP_ID=MMETSP0902-20130614/57154_1 /ASSEMBLY_ACC=CAM_ASM_000551 /TAXON_ID=420261 /ORGANISM="Thalassiosira antarctica, Strain CCMP982" /LENGTH=348 /DNA_ID=CAMNT_0048440839 /DNA_START=248 /DNA_END=1294 /DNA_ORIENTATION=-